MATILRLLFSILTLLVCLWPYWVYQMIEGILQPVGFWQKAVMLIGGLYFLGFFQLVFAMVWFALLWFIWVVSREA